MKMRQIGKALVVVGSASLVAVSNASAEVVLTGVTLDTATPETLAATVLTGLGVIWGIRKLVKLVNRS